MSSKQAVATVTDKMPAYMKGLEGSGRGSEQVEANDLVIPRLELAQALSACVKKKDPAYIPGCEVGMVYNNVTREIYGEQVTIVPVFFRKEYLVWVDRKSPGAPAGVGFRGAFSSKADADAEILSNEDGKHCEVVETAQHFVVIVREDGGVEEAVISMAKSKMKVSKQFNTLIRLNGGDRFSRAYALSSIDDQNGAGDDYQNFSVTNVGFPSEEVYKHAESVYESVASGKRDVDRSSDEDINSVDDEEI